MALITVLPGGTYTISNSEADTVNLAALSTLDVFGTPSNVINVMLSQVSGVGLASTVAIDYATVSLQGVVGASALVNYRIGDGGRLEIANTANASLGSTLAFTGSTGRVDLANGISLTSLSALSPFDSFAGFGAGNLIDVGAGVATHVAYTAHAGTNTGGDLDLLDASNNLVSRLDLTDGTFTAANFKLAADGANGTLVSYVTPVTGISDNPSTADLGAGATVTVTVAVQNPITVTGTPRLLLNDGGVATYDAAHSTSTALAFTYVVGAGQNTADLAVTGVDLNGATLATVGGGGVDLSGAVANPAGILQIDTTRPTVTAAVDDHPTAVLGAGHVVTFTLTPSEAVAVSGAPALLLSDGGTATYVAAASTAMSLVFRYTTAAGQNAADLAITGLSLGAGTIADLAGNALNASSAAINPAGTLTIDTTTPTIISSATNPGSGTLSTGQSVTISLGVSEGVSATGAAPTLQLSDGGVATFDAANSTATQLVFHHTVQAGQTTADLAIIGASNAGNPIADVAGNVLNLTGAIGNPAGILAVDGSSSSGGGTSGSQPDLPIYRFFDSVNGTHFYTPSSGERSQILATRPDLIPEGSGGVGLRAVNPANNDPNASEVFRFFDSIHGTQFLTASTNERDTILATRPDLVYEPAGNFFEHTQPQATDTAVYRFFSSTDGTHFYTDSAGERATILQTRPDLIAEGVGFYEPR